MDKDAVIATLRAHRADLERMGVIHAALFGSLARGEAGPQSDIDIAVDMDDDVVRTVYDYVGVKLGIADFFDDPVDVVNRASLKPGVSESVARDLIYAF
ncbi:MAG: nucleotidyltransferase domain-containing protein [Devosia sp.]